MDERVFRDPIDAFYGYDHGIQDPWYLIILVDEMKCVGNYTHTPLATTQPKEWGEGGRGEGRYRYDHRDGRRRNRPILLLNVLELLK